MEKILITGATGFIGGFIVDEALNRNMEVWVAVRKSSSRQWLTDERINFIELNLSSQSDLEKQLADMSFDYIVHAAGVTKSLNVEDFYRINTEGTKNLVRALLALKMPIKKFVFVSSLSVYGPVREEQPYTEILESDTPQPNTAYGKSKLAAEEFLRTTLLETHNAESSIPYVILRPTGVYGPRERDYFLMAKSIKNHTDFAVGYKPQDITFVYVTDVVQAIFLAIESDISGRSYFLSDGEVYRSSTFSDLIRKELGNPWWIRITAPLWVLRLVTFFGEHISHITGKISALNNDKYNIMKQRNWRCDITPAIEELGYRPQVKLKEGVRRAIHWYKENKWL